MHNQLRQRALVVSDTLLRACPLAFAVPYVAN